ncbi:hypothetical protein Hypma_006006 [Hypsizygus marmoreus]|uniref:Uncharacterized protein n=1 Tax=Hypsizygus marmoreus TaxID=39966 RepID=A0A369KCW0_HYPMA|nr:hypothetical protein Hypma_006006 [Hypsizygus marmoreus]
MPVHCQVKSVPSLGCTLHMLMGTCDYSLDDSDIFDTRTKYKTVDRKVCPVPSYMPDESNQMFQPVTIPQLPPLSLNPPLLENFVPTERLTHEHLDVILASVPEGFLQPREIDLLVDILQTRELGLAFVDSECGTFSDEFYPDYEISVIEHTP